MRALRASTLDFHQQRSLKTWNDVWELAVLRYRVESIDLGRRNMTRPAVKQIRAML
jgi:hypothetical protein